MHVVPQNVAVASVKMVILHVQASGDLLPLVHFTLEDPEADHLEELQVVLHHRNHHPPPGCLCCALHLLNAREFLLPLRI